MTPLDIFQRKMADLVASMPIRDGSDPETKHRNQTYYTHLRDLNHEDFIEACDRILFEDEWFPTIARIRDVCGVCAAGRLRREQAHTYAAPTMVCIYCRGARWVRLGGYDPMNMHAGETGSRVALCPHCTTDRRYDPAKERDTIAAHGGYAVPGQPDIQRSDTLPGWLEALRNSNTGKIDMNLLYRKSRELRGLDPDVDERPAHVKGWKSAGSVAARELVRR